MANIPNVQFVPCFVDSGGTVEEFPNAAVWARNRVPQPKVDNGSGGAADPVGPQRWPLKL
jgi:hypothetical protein